jgi:hypothetical protein
MFLGFRDEEDQVKFFEDQLLVDTLFLLLLNDLRPYQGCFVSQECLGDEEKDFR